MMELETSFTPMIWKNRDRRSTLDDLGFLPQFLSAKDTRSAAEQLDENYRHGGGWRPLPGWTMLQNDKIYYPGEPALLPLWETTLRQERVLVYPHGWVAVVRSDGTYEVARMD